jgi:xylulokinase
VAAVALPHDWLTWRLRGYGPADDSLYGPDLEQLVTDRSDASGTGYWGPATGTYDLDLFERILGRAGRVAQPGNRGLSGVVLPRVLEHDEAAGLAVVAGATAESGVVVGPGAGDNAGAALGLGASAGDVVISIGTSGTVFAVTDAVASDETGAVAGFADASGRFLPLVATLNAARILDSIAGLLGVDHAELGALALAAEPGSDGLVLVPYFEGERTPNRPDATATLSGMTLASTSRPNLARAAVEGMLAALADGLDAVRATGVRESRLLLIGGAAQNEAVARIAAQVFDAPVVVPAPAEYVADGAAVQAAWALTRERPAWPVTMVSEPEPDTRAVIRRQYSERASAV